MNEAVCRTCGARDAHFVGELPDGYLFAGRRLMEGLPGGGLWRCRHCGFAFRHPLLGDAVYERLYRDGGLDVWDVEQLREDFQLIRKHFFAVEAGAMDVVDIGCYTGQLLASLPPSCRLFGVEPNKEAAGVAAARGVTVIADTLKNFTDAGGQYDVITACDVIEHVANPLDLLRQLRDRLKPAGRLVITTGNCDAWLWRLVGSGYWYCQFPEHISFIGHRWVQTMPSRVGMRLTEFIPFNYRGGRMSVPRVVATILYRWNPDLYHMARRVLRGANDAQAPPGSGATRDHMLCAFEMA